MKVLLTTFIFVGSAFANEKEQLMRFDDGSTLEGRQMRPSVELVVDPGEVFGSAVFIETLEVDKVAEKGISEALLEEIK